jgi:hypothetical protein
MSQRPCRSDADERYTSVSFPSSLTKRTPSATPAASDNRVKQIPEAITYTTTYPVPLGDKKPLSYAMVRTLVPNHIDTSAFRNQSDNK